MKYALFILGIVMVFFSFQVPEHSILYDWLPASAVLAHILAIVLFAADSRAKRAVKAGNE